MLMYVDLLNLMYFLNNVERHRPICWISYFGCSNCAAAVAPPLRRLVKEYLPPLVSGSIEVMNELRNRLVRYLPFSYMKNGPLLFGRNFEYLIAA